MNRYTKIATTRLVRMVMGLTFLTAGIFFSYAVPKGDIPSPKREFRGAWLHVIGQSQYMDMSTEKAKAYISDQLDKLQEAGCNAVIFQVRPTADAMYESELEPWSYWLTGKRGRAPEPMWDPLKYALDEAHRRGMEFHAWLNPYRVTSTPKEVLPSSHMVNKEPHRFVRFDGKIFFDPAYPENRDFICEVVKDITRRYDVDAIHIDDYFYPYPANGKRFEADDASYRKFGNGMERRAWRRHNVDMLIQQLDTTIKNTKPWVRFGVSPFGIWRNKANDPKGSESSGLQNYDDLYADVLLWAEKGWIDYLVPQLYWTLDMKAAPSRKLAKWWNDNTPAGVDLYIGQDVQRTMTNADPGTGDRNELATKVRLSRELPNVKGNVWWHGYWVTGNLKGVADSLATRHQRTLALPPAWGDKSVRPVAPSGLKSEIRDGMTIISWNPPARDTEQSENDIIRYAVYEFFEGETPDIENTEALIAVTPVNALAVGPSDGSLKGTVYLITALDRMNRESAPARFSF